MIVICSSADQFSYLEERVSERGRTSRGLLADLHLFLLSIRRICLDEFSETDDQ